MTSDEAKQIVQSAIEEVLRKPVEVSEDVPLIGGSAQIDSMKLVELCLALEDRAADLGFEFDWTSEAAMSRSRSMFRTTQTLSEEFARQAGVEQ